MDDKIQKEVRWLKAYALVSVFLFAGLIFLAFRGPAGRVKFCEIDAERINILEKDGTLRLAIANSARVPGGTMAGVELKSRAGKRGAGLIYFNDVGDECGGLAYSGKMVNGKPSAFGMITLDHYGQNEAVSMSYSEEDGSRKAGFGVFDQPAKPFSAEFMHGFEDIHSRMKDGPEKEAALKKLMSEHSEEIGWTPRVFVGRSSEEGAAVILMDDKARPRIRMAVDASNAPVFEFLDEKGNVVHRLPDARADN